MKAEQFFCRGCHHPVHDGPCREPVFTSEHVEEVCGCRKTVVDRGSSGEGELVLC